MSDEQKAEQKKVPGVFRITKGAIEVVCKDHDKVLATTKGQDLNAGERALLIDAGQKHCTWCKADVDIVWPEFQAKVFVAE
jgi:hypothetical protein